MNRRRLALAASSAAVLSGSAALAPIAVVSQATRSPVPEYVGAMTVMWRSVQWFQREVSQLMDEQNREDEEWGIDVLAPFAVVDAVREAGRMIAPPRKYATSHALWLDALDEFVAAGLHLRNGVLADNERSFALATRTMDRAADLLDEVEAGLPRRVRRTSQAPTRQGNAIATSATVSGSGTDVSEKFRLDGGRYLVTASLQVAGSGGFVCDLMGPNGFAVSLFNELIDEPQDWTARTTVQIDVAGRYFVAVSNTDGRWTLELAAY